MSTWKRLLVAGVCVVLAIGVAACKQAAQKAVEQATGVKVEDDGGSVTVKTDEGEATVKTGQKLPERFPESVPVYEGTIETASSMTAGGTETFSVVVQADDDLDTVKKFYLKEMPARGWKVQMTLDTGTGESRGVLITAEREGLGLNVTLEERSGGKTQVTLMVGSK